jgi:hypothetical protein
LAGVYLELRNSGILRLLASSLRREEFYLTAKNAEIAESYDFRFQI